MNRKAKINKCSLFAVAMLSLLLSSCALTTAQSGNRITPSKKIITKTVNVSASTTLIVENSLAVEFIQDETPSVTIEGADNLVPNVEIVQNDDKMVVKWKKNINISSWNFNRPPVVVHVSMPDVKSLRLDGSGDIFVTSNLRVKELSVELNGSGSIRLKSVQCNAATAPGSFVAQLNGSGDLYAAGEVKAEKVSLNLAGSGDVAANGVIANKFSADLSGSGDLKAKAVTTSLAAVELNGSGDLKVDGIETVSLKSVLAGSGGLTVNGIKAQSVLNSLSGSGDVYLSGICETARLNLTNSGTINASKLQAQSVDASVDGSGDIDCNAQMRLNSSIQSGSGSVSYVGNPRITATGRNKPERK